MTGVSKAEWLRAVRQIVRDGFELHNTDARFLLDALDEADRREQAVRDLCVPFGDDINPEDILAALDGPPAKE